MTSAPKPRPKYYDLNLANLPPAGILSILHRGSGAFLFLAIPLFLYVLQAALSQESEYLHWRKILSDPMVKLILLGGFWLFAHHFFAGIRYLFLDVHVGVEKEASRQSAIVVLVAGIVATLVVGAVYW